MSNHLKQQAERILDESDSNSFSIIVQMRSPDEESQKVIRAAHEVAGMRNQTLSSRDLMPPPAKEMHRKRMTATAKKALNKNAQSMASQIALAACATQTKKALISRGRKSVRVAMKNRSMKEFVSTCSDKNKPVEFWSSSSIVLDVQSKDQLAKFAAAAGKDIANIYLNRTIQMPTPVSVRNLPSSVAESENESSTWGLETTNAMAAWGAYGARGAGVKVAVLDTGVDATHPTLNGRIKKFAEFDKQGNIVADGGPSIAYDSAKHGTHCCGTVAGQMGGAKGNIRIGMAPDAEIYAGLVLKKGKGSDAQIIAGMEWAIQKGADVISMSLGGLRLTPEVMDTYTRTIISANSLGIPVIIAMGNDGHQTSGAPGNDFFAFSVGATDVLDQAAGFSGGQTQIIRNSQFIHPDFLPLSYQKPDVSAPGVAVYSCIPGKKFASWNGTSMATPHVAGAIAQLLSVTSLKNEPVERRAYIIQDFFRSTIDELGEAGHDQRYGQGRIDVLRAIGYARNLGYV